MLDLLKKGTPPIINTEAEDDDSEADIDTAKYQTYNKAKNRKCQKKS